MRVLKYPVPVDGHWHALPIPTNARILHVACQDGPDVVQMWVLIDGIKPGSPPMFCVYGTGQDVLDGVHWVGTCLAADGRLVWHVFCDQRIGP